MTQHLTARRAESERGLGLVRQSAARHLSPIVGEEPLAIYLTGSFGRLEARFPKGSDLDLFFLYGPADRSPKTRLSQLTWFELAGELIRIGRELDFEEFSRDGAFLQVHNVWHIGRQLGSQHEDAENGFTARLLLLLESRYVLNEALYEQFMQETIGSRHLVGKAAAEAEVKVGQILEGYEYFLQLMAEEGALLERLTSHNERDLTRRKAAAFGQIVSEFMLATCQGDQLRSLLI